MRLRLQKFSLNVRYVPGKYLYIADTLSRAFYNSVMPENNDMHDDMDALIHGLVESLPISDSGLNDLRQLTQKKTKL